MSIDLRDAIRAGESFAPDADDLLRTVTAAQRRRRHRRHVLLIAAVVAAVVLIAGTTTIAVMWRSAGPAELPPSPVVPTTAPTGPSHGTAETGATQRTETGSAQPSAPTTASTAVGSTTSAGQKTGTVAGTGAGTAGIGSGHGSVAAADLATYHWSELPKAPIAGRSGAATVWTGSEMLIWGGENSFGTKHFGDGAAYDPSTRQWRTLPASPLDARVPATWVWTGSDLFVWGGGKGQQNGALYDPASNSWKVLPTLPSASDGTGSTLEWATAVWTGHEIVLLVWSRGSSPVTAWAYQPGAHDWTARGTITPRKDAQIYWAVAASVNGVTYAWVAWWHSTVLSKTSTGVTFGSGTRVSGFALDGSTWRRVEPKPSLGALGPVTVAGNQVIMDPAQSCWGPCLGPSGILPSQRIDPETGVASAMPVVTDGDVINNYQVVWTGAAVLGYGVTPYTKGAGGAKLPGETMVWDPGADRWQYLSQAPLVNPEGTTGVWTGSELLVWGLLYPPDEATTGQAHYRAAGLQFAPPAASTAPSS